MPSLSESCPSTQPEKQGTYIPLLLVVLGIAGLLGYRWFRARQGVATVVGVISQMDTQDARGNALFYYEFRVAGTVYTGHYKAYYATRNSNGELIWVGQHYQVTYAITDPDVSTVDFEHPLPAPE